MSFGEFFVKHWQELLSVLITIASIIYSIVILKKSGNTKGIKQLYTLIPELVTEAEQMFGAGNGQAKLNYVLTKLRVYALEHSIKVDSVDLTNQIESVVTTTKFVNIDKATPSINNNQTSENAVGNVAESGKVNSEININI